MSWVFAISLFISAATYTGARVALHHLTKKDSTLCSCCCGPCQKRAGALRTALPGGAQLASPASSAYEPLASRLLSTQPPHGAASSRAARSELLCDALPTRTPRRYAILFLKKGGPISLNALMIVNTKLRWDESVFGYGLGLGQWERIPGRTRWHSLHAPTSLCLGLWLGS